MASPVTDVRQYAVTERSHWLAELRATFALAWPLVIAQVAQNAIGTTDVIMMGWLGPEALAAGTLASTFITPFLVAGIGLIGAVAPLTAQARGSRNIKAVRRIVRQGFWVGALAACILIPILWQIRAVLGLLGQDIALAERAEEYVHIAAWVLIPAFGIITLRSLLSTFDAARVILVITVGGVLLNIVGNYVLMFGHLGLPRLEIRGAALATVITNIAMFAALLIQRGGRARHSAAMHHPRIHGAHGHWHGDHGARRHGLWPQGPRGRSTGRMDRARPRHGLYGGILHYLHLACPMDRHGFP
jgi:Na+-driven multidrug efflux pump